MEEGKEQTRKEDGINIKKVVTIILSVAILLAVINTVLMFAEAIRLLAFPSNIFYQNVPNRSYMNYLAYLLLSAVIVCLLGLILLVVSFKKKKLRIASIIVISVAICMLFVYCGISTMGWANEYLGSGNYEIRILDYALFQTALALLIVQLVIFAVLLFCRLYFLVKEKKMRKLNIKKQEKAANENLHNEK